MKIALVVPTFNADTCIIEFYNSVKKYFDNDSIIFVNDGSTDKSLEIFKNNNLLFVNHEKNFGKGAALKTGFSYALKNNFDFVLTMDVDLQHSADDIKSFIKIAEENCFDIAIGNRLKNLKNMPFHRVLSNFITSFLVRLKTRQEIIDSQCGFRIYRTFLLKALPTLSNGFEFETEILFWAAKNSFKITSIPIKTIYNNNKSKMKHFQTTKNFIISLFKKY